MQQQLFSANAKLCDLITTNPALLHILDRCGIRFGFGEKTVKSVCEEYSVDVHFFLLICNIYTFDGYLPEEEQFNSINISALIEYLKLSHSHYLIKRVPHIEAHICRIASIMPAHVSSLLTEFFNQFKTVFSKHFTYEECTIFPHVQNILEGRRDSVKYNASAAEHANIHNHLNDLVQIVVKYLPPSQTTDDMIDVVVDLLELSVDIKHHQDIEDKILHPIVKQLEKTLR